MIVAGCLSLVVLPLAGLTVGTLLWGTAGALWGAITGLAGALLIAGVSGYALLTARRRD